MTATIVHLLRHGEVHNPNRILYGRLPDFHLSTTGQKMAVMAADFFAERGADITHVVSSPLERAQETAAPLSEATGLKVNLDVRVLEAGNQFEGDNVYAQLRRPQNWLKLHNPATPSWGEPYRDIAVRMVAAVTDARNTARGHEAVIVSHQLPIWTTYLAAAGRSYLHDPRTRRCNLASVTSLHFYHDELIGTTYYEPAAALYPV